MFRRGAWVGIILVLSIVRTACSRTSGENLFVVLVHQWMP